tara:strand:+ start:871 stop:1008 length:138 start_codon:yes stop_codon:yes gene_type:complete
MAKYIHEMSKEELKRINKRWYIFVKKHNAKYLNPNTKYFKTGEEE